MGTRSLIGVLNPNQLVTYIYCHRDGYPSHNGQILIDHYTDFQKIQELLKLGDLSVLGEQIGTKHPFETHNLSDEEKAKYEGMCTAYGRDRGEKGTQASTAKTVQKYKDEFKENWAEYAYLFDDGQ